MNTKALLNEIQTGAYTYGRQHARRQLEAAYRIVLTNSVLLSPEIALSNKFKKILQDQNFQQHLVLVAIDEVHVVSEWGQH